MFGISTTFITALIPLIGALFIVTTDKRNIIGIKAVSFWTILFALCFSIIPIITCNTHSQLTFENVFSNKALKYDVILDAVSLLFVPIINLICLLCVLWITKTKTPKKKSYYVSILVFESLSIGAFYASNIFLLYAFIESTILPLYIIMSQGKEYSEKSILYFLTYTMMSAVLILIAFIIIYLDVGSADLKTIYQSGIKSKTVFWLLALGIGIKLPIWPFYSWLPIVHVKNQTICSVLLASIVLKFSSLILIRVMLPLFSDLILTHYIVIFSIIFVSLVFSLSQLTAQDDIKAVFAYFSIIHLNTALIIALNKTNLVYYTFAITGHSILMPVLFFASSLIERSCKTRSVKFLKLYNTQIFSLRKIVSFAFFVFASLPFSWGFITEIVTIQLAAKFSYLFAILLSGIILLSSFFVIYVYNSIFSCKLNILTPEANERFVINNVYKKLAFCIPLVLIFLIGIFPNIILGYFK